MRCEKIKEYVVVKVSQTTQELSMYDAECFSSCVFLQRLSSTIELYVCACFTLGTSII